MDHAVWNYRPVLGSIQRSRFQLLLALLRDEPRDSLLEIGFGSGVLLPQLKHVARQLYGLDVHEEIGRVSEVLASRGVPADLVAGSATDIPFSTGSFDCVVAVSCLEYVEEIDLACSEIRRVMATDGVFVIVTPFHSALADLGHRLVTGVSATDHYGGRRKRLLPALLRTFSVEEWRTARIARIGPPIYHGLRLRPRQMESETG